MVGSGHHLLAVVRTRHTLPPFANIGYSGQHGFADANVFKVHPSRS